MILLREERTGKEVKVTEVVVVEEGEVVMVERDMMIDPMALEMIDKATEGEVVSYFDMLFLGKCEMYGFSEISLT